MGKPVDRVYDTQGERVSEIRHEETLFGTPVDRTYDNEGNLLSETRKEDTLTGIVFGLPPDKVIYEGGKKIGRLERDDRLLLSILEGERRWVGYDKQGRDVDLLTRTDRGSRRSDLERRVGDGDGEGIGGSSSRSIGSGNEESTNLLGEVFLLSYHIIGMTIASVASFLGWNKWADKKYAQVVDNLAWYGKYKGDYEGALLVADNISNKKMARECKKDVLETQIHRYILDGRYYDAREVAVKHKVEKFFLRECKWFLPSGWDVWLRYIDCGELAESKGFIKEAVEFYDRSAENTRSVQTRLELLKTAAELAEKGGLRDDAIILYRKGAMYAETAFAPSNLHPDILALEISKKLREELERLVPGSKGIRERTLEKMAKEYNEALEIHIRRTKT